MGKWSHSLPRMRYIKATGERAHLVWVGEGESYVVEGCIVSHNGQRRWMKFRLGWTFLTDTQNWVISPKGEAWTNAYTTPETIKTQG